MCIYRLLYTYSDITGIIAALVVFTVILGNIPNIPIFPNNHVYSGISTAFPKYSEYQGINGNIMESMLESVLLLIVNSFTLV